METEPRLLAKRETELLFWARVSDLGVQLRVQSLGRHKHAPALNS